MSNVEWNNPAKEKAAKEYQQQVEIITKIFNQIFQQFSPAKSLAESDLHITSEELYNKIQLHYPSESLSIQLIYDSMIEAGYRFESFPNKVELVWLLKRRESAVLS